MFDWALNGPMRFANKAEMFMKIMKHRSSYPEGLPEIAVL